MLGGFGRKSGAGGSRGREIDVLWLVEHVARELGVACVARVTTGAIMGCVSK